MLMKQFLMLSDRGQTNIYTIYTNGHILSAQEREKKRIFIYGSHTSVLYDTRGL